jgi:penicillin-binding protein 1A
VANVGGEWYYSEYADGSGVASLGLEEPPAPTEPAAVEEERKGILDLFKR